MYDELDEIKKRYNSIENVPESLMQALMKQESGFNPNAQSPVGAYGLTQVMPSTFPEINKELGYEGKYSFDDFKNNPELQKLYGKHYLSKQMKNFDNNEALALAAYNWGEGNVKKHLKNNPNLVSNFDVDSFVGSGIAKETQGYISNIFNNYKQLPTKQELTQKIMDYKSKLGTPKDFVQEFVAPELEPDKQRLSNLSDIEKYKKLLAEVQGKKMIPNQTSSDVAGLATDSMYYNDKIKDLENDPVTKFNPKIDDVSKRVMAKLGLDKIIPTATVKSSGNKKLDDSDFFVAPDDTIRNEQDLMREELRNTIPQDGSEFNQQYISNNNKENSPDKEVLDRGSNPIFELLNKLKEAQIAQTKNTGLMALLRAGGGIADAMAAGRGANTTKIGNESLDLLEKNLGLDVSQIQDQANMIKAQQGLNATEESMNPNSPLSKMQQGFISNMMNQLGLDSSQVGQVSAKNSEDLMRSLSYMMKAQQDKSDRETLKQDKISEKTKLMDDKNLQKLSKDISPLQDIYNSLDQVEAEMGFNLEDYNIDKNKVGNKKVDLPGVSIPLIGRTSFYDGRAKNLRSAMDTLFNEKLKIRSGAAVTDNELARLRNEYAEGKFDTEEGMLNALSRLKKVLGTGFKNKEAAYSDSILQTYQDREGSLPFSRVNPDAIDTNRLGKDVDKTVKKDYNGKLDRVKQLLEDPNVSEETKQRLKQSYGL